MSEDKSHDRLELRSEKVKKILGDIPRPLVLWGYAILVVVGAGLAVMVWKFPQFWTSLTRL